MKPINRFFSLIILLNYFLGMIFMSCKEEIEISTPEIITIDVTSITSSSAKISGKIILDGNTPIIESGVVYAKNPDPTIANFKVVSGVTNGNFSVELTELDFASTYHVRVFATNKVGTSYGVDVLFSTLPAVPVVSTTQPTEIFINTAKIGGNILSDGGTPIISRGICWNTLSNPTISDNITTEGEGIGNFTSLLSNLNADTKYYVRAFAKNNVGVAYGEQLSFTTIKSTVTDIDGNTYNIILIGTQLWMKENLKVTKYSNGESIPNVTGPTLWKNIDYGAWCYYNNDPSLNSIYGKLYNWFSVNDARKLCPAGWHIPKDSEWSDLTNTLGGADIAGNKMKSFSELWIAQDIAASNSSNFSALPGGLRSIECGGGGCFGAFLLVGKYAGWWSSTELTQNPQFAWYRSLSNSDGVLYRNTPDKESGFSIRCLKD